METTLEDLKDKNLAELTTHLQEMAPSVLEAKARYDALIAEQRLFLAARALKESGLWIGQKIRLLDGAYNMKQPIAEIVGADSYGVQYNVLKKDGTRRSDNSSLYSFTRFEPV